MADSIQRATFYEGQVLASADLEEAVSYARDQMARHERMLHSWGITEGLDLGSEQKGTGANTSTSIFVNPGAAIDGTGREIVVAAKTDLPADAFAQVVDPTDDNKWYPVFLVGADEQPPAAQSLTGVCTQAQPNRVVESFQLQFGRPGDELDLDDQPRPDPTGGPGGGGWRVLLGFVKAKAGKFDQVARDATPPTVSPRYAGVRADAVLARGPSLTLQTSLGAQGKPQLMLDESNGGQLTFRLSGQSAPVFTVKANGDVDIAGKLGTGGSKDGSVLVDSGVASDGMILPLPKGVIDPSVVQLHFHVTPHIDANNPPATVGTALVGVPRECTVDPDTRRVSCTTLWIGSALPIAVLPSQCDYTVLAVFPPTTR